MQVKYKYRLRDGTIAEEIFTLDEIEFGMVTRIMEGYEHDGNPCDEGKYFERELVETESCAECGKEMDDMEHNYGTEDIPVCNQCYWESQDPSHDYDTREAEQTFRERQIGNHE